MSPKLTLVAPAAGGLATRTHCPYCAFQCGMTVTRQPAQGPGASAQGTHAHEVEVRADPDFPVNRGQMCIKGFHSAALLDHPGRVLTPQIRGVDGVLRPASWEEALSFVAAKLASIRERYGADANGAFGSGALTNEKAYLLGKFVRVVLGSSQVDYNGRYCMASAAAGQNRAYGIDRGLPFPVSDIGETKVLMLWGSNVADTSGSDEVSPITTNTSSPASCSRNAFRASSSVAPGTSRSHTR